MLCFHLKQRIAKELVRTSEEIMFLLKYNVANDTREE